MAPSDEQKRDIIFPLAFANHPYSSTSDKHGSARTQQHPMITQVYYDLSGLQKPVGYW